VQAGQYVKLTLGSYPNAETQARGGERILQMLGRQYTPVGPVYQYLDAGPSAQPTTAPAVTLAAGPAGSTKHALNVTIGGISGRAYAQIAFGSTRPPDTSTRWEAAFDTASTAAQTVYSLPANTTAHIRAWNLKPKRFASAYAYSTQRATAALASLSSFQSSVSGGNYVAAVWGNGETLPVDLHVDPSTSASIGTSNYVATVGVGVTRYTYVGLTSNSTYLFLARHRDIYGGVGPSASFVDYTSGALQTAGSLTLAILAGGST
jgi:hypothetical protein